MLENRPQFPTIYRKPPQTLQSQLPGTSIWVSSPGDVIIQRKLTKLILCPKGSLTAAQDTLVTHTPLASPLPSGAGDWSPSTALPQCQTPANSPLLLCIRWDGAKSMVCRSVLPLLCLLALSQSLCPSWSLCMFHCSFRE